ncbi:hypothetical protein [Granulicella tundricola]|uniref:DUF2442 domain-containing protein n=1 Tax=Granulicella tundricola (strain ATCC BAA-1859 / DSM 23138 / MP5ACTX9) TaxID=1198114 RepID=E8X0E2_GRATM|nr:hypothetical protein [Granulicella tundricola]ADW67806.1 hypothetical protein AciX9_0736 [Granulicella tundricola MP5ACTX9]
MESHLGIIEVDYENDQSLLINFSDGTFASFSVLDLAAMQPNRILADGDHAETGQ